MILPNPPKLYDQNEQAQTRRRIMDEDRQNHKKNANVEIGDQKLILKSPDGTRWEVTVDNSGNLDATSL